MSDMVRNIVTGCLFVLLMVACQPRQERGFEFKPHMDSIVLESKVYDIKARFPRFNHDYTDSLIHENVQSMIEEFKKNVGDEIISENWKNEQVVNCDLAFTKNGILSVIFRNYQFTGGAHGNTFLSSVVLQPNKQKVYQLQDFFSESVVQTIQEPVREVLRNQLDSDTFIEEGTETLADFKVFSLTDETLIFYFPPYQVAAYAFGTPMVKINRKSLNGFEIPN